MIRKAILASAAVLALIITTIAVAQTQRTDEASTLLGKQVTLHISPESLGAPMLSGGFSLNGRRLTITGTLLSHDQDWVRIRRVGSSPHAQTRTIQPGPIEIIHINTRHIIAIAALDH